MKSISLHICCLFTCWVFSTLKAQVDTTILLPEMEFIQIRKAAIGLEKIVWDSTTLKSRSFASLGDFLSQESNVYVKSYGGNSLGTISVQGASASQTLLLWNGLPVQSPMLGLLDLSLIPLNFSDKVSLQVGGNSSSWGSGAIGGVIGFQNTGNFKSKFELDYNSSIGSFSSLQQDLQLKGGSKHFQSVTQVNFQKAKNDILVRPAPNVENYRQENAAFLQMGLIQSFYVKPNDKNELAIHAWLQESEKEIPPTLTQLNSEAFQKDQIKRFMASWAYKNKKHNIKVKAGHFREQQEFIDPQIHLQALNKFQTSLGEANYNFKFNTRHSIEVASTTIFTMAQSESYSEVNTQFKTAGLFAYRLTTKQTQLQLSLREEWVDKNLLAPLPYIGWQQGIGSRLVLKAKVSREFRLPTLNDLYWSPGGNPELKPEEGWSQELGLTWRQKFKGHQLKLTNSVFNRNIKNWILWAPSDLGFFWGANNIAKVWSYGLSSRLDYDFKKGKFVFNSNLSFNYTNSTYQISLDLPKIEKGDQLFYTPKYQANGNVSLKLGEWSFRYQHLLIGETLGANDLIPRYHVGNIHLAYSFKQNNFSGKIFTSINNIYNQNYRVVERRAMPGTNLLFGININLKK